MARSVFIIFTIVGIVVPYSIFLPFIIEHGFNIPLIIQEAAANRIASFAWLDVIISALVLLTAGFGGKLISVRQALPVTIATCLAGVSAGLPLFFYFLLSNKKS